ncbi:selenide, water dikinase [Maridesulfovibrio salexigens DSM 2638]|uniref:Selenide, water dikinase n=1 Tax=Maridesulfovibrio salexigens (strain ATCC 14822 / DSM 2638 / NCIMB 8403 / VKM B-1763) TaxID=526222 RepID=C6BYB5_MARSD|nr:selenide, water dikinase [Maridesulfovibrio salexigens DSM 2638]
MCGLAVEDERLLTGLGGNEDSAIVSFPAGKALVQTVDFFTPVVNDPYWFGQIAAANSLSDVYAMGGEPWTAMNIVCYPMKEMGPEILREILKGGMDKIREAGAVLAGGHSVEDDEIKYGLSVTGMVDPDGFASNKGLREGDQLLLTKPLGTGVLATALKADWDGAERFEKDVYKWASRLNSAGGKVIRELGLIGATDITGFGLGGHVLEMADASGVAVELWLDKVPFMDDVVDLASMGMIPAGSFANRNYCSSQVQTAADADSIKTDLIFDAQTSGGLILAVPEDKLQQAKDMLLEAGDLADHVGQVTAHEAGVARLRIV